MKEKECMQLKLLIIGESGVGKTSILQRFIENTFQRGFTSTIGIDFRSKKIEVDGEEVELQLWDTAGQERFFSITKSYYRGSDGIFLTFDISSMSSFHSTEKWVSAIQGKVEENVPIFLLANKKDLVDELYMEKLGTIQKIKMLSSDLHVPWYVTSAQSGENIEEIFTDMARTIIKKKKAMQPAKKPKKKKFAFSHSSLRKVFSCW
ncbi:Ras-related protein Rab-1A [Nematocida sp. LUAm3]|nr:Ras-related protein Rab-1A [Nematocida sp. LUAm3]KAI5173960.1 Ras-related protein Rab-1A [Nematocida sp. LUAm2]KAI5177295.1 Ras-related protein Rab-1A [Nematocida sp. LUAm1]